MAKSRMLTVLDEAIRVTKDDYISLTDMLRSKDGDFFTSDWLRNRNTLEYLGIWERIHNPDFNWGEFAIIKSQAGLNSYKISVKQWVEQTQAIGIQAKAEEKISKQKAKQLFDSGDINQVQVGTFAGLAFIHSYLFGDIYDFAGKVRDVNIAKGETAFARVMYLDASLTHIEKMPQRSFDEIIEKYVEMNMAHPFREGNGRATRIWLDVILKTEIQQVINWNQVDKEEYLSAMQRSPVKDVEIKALLKQALTDKIDDRALFMKGIDVSYFYEGYSEFKTEEL